MNSESFISVANFISIYFYELSNGVKMPLNTETLKSFEKTDKDLIKKVISSAESNKYSNELILKEINNKIFEYYSKNTEINLESSRDILNNWRNNSLNRYLNETDYLQDTINEKIETQIAFINLDNKSYHDKLKALAENVNPYSAFSEKEIKRIDTNFFKKNSILIKINHGNDYFKRSKLKESIDCYDRAIKLISEEKEIENLHLYFYAWVLHQLGNIYYVIGNFDKAVSLFNNSFSIKTKIEDLPKPLLFATQLKIFGLLSYFPFENNNWNINLNSFLKKITEYHLYNQSGNKLFINNLICDANFYLLNGYTQLNDRINSEKYFKISITKAQENEDFAGLVKIYSTKYLAEKSDRHLNKLKTILRQANEIQKTDPYITTIFKNSKISVHSKNKMVVERVKKVFIDNEIKLIE